jgi:hypothetical protein
MKQLLSLCLLFFIAGLQNSQAQLGTTTAKATTKVIPQISPTVQIDRMALSKEKYEYKSKNGKVEIGYGRGKQPKDNVRTLPKETSEAMCLSKEEVRGQKIENLQVIIDASQASQILPGGVIDGEMLLKSGEFRYMKMTKRKPISVSLVTNQGKKTNVTVDKKENNNMEDDLRAAVNAMKSPRNIGGMPNISSSSEVITSTLEENTGLKIGASFFYMGVKADNKFNFSSSSYHYMYVYQFEQECLSVVANTVSSPDELFTDGTGKDDNLLYIREVKYGRRLYVIIETENELQSYSDKLKTGIDWKAVEAQLNMDLSHSSVSDKINMRINTQGGSPIGAYDKKNVQKILNDYFSKPYKQIDIVPISYKMTYTDGEPVSIISDAFLDGKNCLDKDRVKIRLASVKCFKAQSEGKNEEVYGGVNLFFYNAAGKQVLPDGKTLLPLGVSMASHGFVFGSKDAPVSLRAGGEKKYQPDEQGKYSALLLQDLDMVISLKPYIHEKDNVLNRDDDFITENSFRWSIRDMLVRNTMSPSFEFRYKDAVIQLFFEIIPE